MNAQMFSILAEPNRLQMVELLHTNPLTVNQIVDKMKIKQPQVSKHLKVLADAGIVAVQPIKNQRIYSLKPDPFKELDAWLAKYRTHLEQSFDKLETLLKKEVKKK